MTPSAILIDIAAIAVFALLVAGAVWLGLRPFLNRDPDARPTGAAAPARTRGLLSIGGLLLVLTFVSLAHAAQIAFGAPVGERTSPVLEVVEVGACERPLTGFGLVRTCELRVYRSTEGLEYAVFPDTIVGGAPIEPGDLVAEYSSSGWTRWMQLFDGRPHWRSLEDTGKPNLAWLPLPALALAMLVMNALGERLRARRGAAPEAAEIR